MASATTIDLGKLIATSLGRPTDTTQAPGSRTSEPAEDQALLPAVIEIVHEAGKHMLERFPSDPRPANRQEVVAAIHANDAAALSILRQRLMEIRPQAGWTPDELESGELPPGEWWVIDPVEGNINHVHGMTDWCITATLVRDGAPVVAAAFLPLTGDTYTAVRGGGAYMDGKPLRPSVKTELDGALLGTGQAKPGEDGETFRRIGESVTAMLDRILVIKVSVPATLQLIHVAAGRMEGFWQFSQVRSGLLAGALLVSEAGGIVTDTRGRPWSLASSDFLATAPGVHRAAVDVLSTIE
jgi:myo-inositol-1(or 4)-monophosphatase